MVWQGWKRPKKPGHLHWFFIFLAPLKPSSSNCFNPFTYYFFSWLVIWLELQILKKKVSKGGNLGFFCACKLFQFPWITWARQKEKGKKWFSDQRYPSFHVASVRREDRRGWQRIVETIRGNWFVLLRSCTMEGSYSPIRYQVEICEKGCLLCHTAYIYFPSRKLAAATKNKT